MNRKLLCIGTVLFLFCFTIMQSGHAQTSVAGVAIGDSFAYEFSAYFRPNVTDAIVPPQLIEDNRTEWVRFTITDVANLTVSYVTLQHLDNGTEIPSQSQADLSTGYGGFPIIRANVTADEPLYPSMSFSPNINETLTRTYPQGQRTILRVTWNDTDYLDAHFDQKTGMPVEFHVIFAATPEGNAEYVYMLMDSNVWTIPEFPPVLVLPLVAASTLVAVLVYKRSMQRKR